MRRPVGSNIRPGSAVFNWNAVSTTRVPLLVTTGAALEELEPAAAPGEPATEDPAAALEVLVDVAVLLLLLLHAATLTTKEAATAPAVHLRMRI